MDNKHIGYAVKSLHRRINQVIGRIPAIKENKNLTSVQIWILNFLFRNEGRDVFQKDIEAEFNTRRSTATELLKQMEKNGLIPARLRGLRRASEKDRRYGSCRGDPQTDPDADRQDRKNDGAEALRPPEIEAFFRLCGTVQAKSRKMRIGHFERVGA